MSLTNQEKEKMRERLIYYAGLFHDIGKFFWRKFEKQRFNHSQLSAFFIEGIQDIPPFQWLEKEERKILKRVVELHHYDAIKKAEEEGEDKEILELARIVSFADRLSAKERAKEEDTSQERNLISIFSLIRLDNEERTSEEIKPVYFKFSPLDLNEIPYPMDSPSTKGFVELIEGFVKEYKKLMSKARTPKDIVILSLLQKYLWCVPSAYYRVRNDISLFEHLKNTGAIAVASYKEYRSGKNIFDNSQSHWLLIGGDISGIQSFIYTLTSKGAAKGLKGRSFYLELLQRAVIKFILEKLGLFEGNVLYYGGGKFFILAHASSEKQLEELEKQIAEYLFDRFEGRLYFALASVAMKEEDFHQIKDTFKNLIEKLNEKKEKKFGTLLKSHYKKFFEPGGEGAKPNLCAVCERDIKEGETVIEGKCEDCQLMEEIGKELKYAKYVAELVGFKPTQDKNVRYINFKFGDFEISYRLLRERLVFTDIDNSQKATIFILNDTDFKDFEWLTNEKVDMGFMFIGGTGLEESETFNEMAENSKGAKKLGVFRADVDNLGRIMGYGFGEEDSISRRSQLSFLLKLFFSGYINKIYGKNVHIIYSGGDDLFVAGAWDRVLEDSIKLNEAFKDFVKNPVFTISGGFVYTNPKFPIYTFSELVGEEEERAKEAGKNRISAFSFAVKWEDFEILKEIKEELVSAIANNKWKGILPRSYLQFLIGVSKSASEEKAFLKSANSVKKVVKSLKYYRWRWLVPYYNARTKKRHKKAKELIDKIERFILKNEWNGRRLSEGDGAILIYVPARWAEIETRRENDATWSEFPGEYRGKI